MPNWMPSLYPGGRARLIPRRTSFNASRRSARSAARYSVTVDAGMGQVYHEGFCRGNCNVRIHPEARAATCPHFAKYDQLVNGRRIGPEPSIDTDSRFLVTALARGPGLKGSVNT